MNNAIALMAGVAASANYSSPRLSKGGGRRASYRITRLIGPESCYAGFDGVHPSETRQMRRATKRKSSK